MNENSMKRRFYTIYLRNHQLFLVEKRLSIFKYMGKRFSIFSPKVNIILFFPCIHKKYANPND